MKKYYGQNTEENRVMFATVTGQMAEGTLVYTECDEKGELIAIDKQYTRRLRGGWQEFIRL